MPFTLYAQGDGNLSGVTWNDAFDGSGTNRTPGVGDTLDASGHNITVSTLITSLSLSYGTWTLASGCIFNSSDMINSAGNFTLSADISVKGTCNWQPSNLDYNGHRVVLAGPSAVTLDISLSGITHKLARDSDAGG